MNFSHLRAFHMVASEGGFTAAAATLGVSQPTLSSQVKSLEDHYGVRLIERRGGRQIRLTELGVRLFEVTRQIFSLNQEAEEILSSGRTLQEGRLRVGADGPHHVMPILAEFSRLYPGVDVTLEMGHAKEMLRELRDTRIDVAIVAKVDEDSNLLARRVSRGRLVLFMRRDHPWAKRDSVKLHELAEQRVIVREAASETRKLFQDAMENIGVSPQSVMQIESREAVREAVAAGLGIGVVVETEFNPDKRLKSLKISGVPLEISEYVVCLQERRRLRSINAFLDVVKNVGRQKTN